MPLEKETISRDVIQGFSLGRFSATIRDIFNDELATHVPGLVEDTLENPTGSFQNAVKTIDTKLIDITKTTKDIKADTSYIRFKIDKLEKKNEPSWLENLMKNLGFITLGALPGLLISIFKKSPHILLAAGVGLTGKIIWDAVSDIFEHKNALGASTKLQLNKMSSEYQSRIDNLIKLMEKQGPNAVSPYNRMNSLQTELEVAQTRFNEVQSRLEEFNRSTSDRVREYNTNRKNIQRTLRLNRPDTVDRQSPYEQIGPLVKPPPISEAPSQTETPGFTIAVVANPKSKNHNQLVLVLDISMDADITGYKVKVITGKNKGFIGVAYSNELVGMTTLDSMAEVNEQARLWELNRQPWLQKSSSIIDATQDFRRFIVNASYDPSGGISGAPPNMSMFPQRGIFGRQGMGLPGNSSRNVPTGGVSQSGTYHDSGTRPHARGPGGTVGHDHSHEQTIKHIPVGTGAGGGRPSGRLGNLTPNEQAMLEFSNKWGMHPAALAGVIDIESNNNPAIQGGASNNYHGIFQLEGKQIPGLTEKAGFGRLTPAEYRKLSFADQLKVMEQYFLTNGIKPGEFFTGDAEQDAARAWAMQLAPGNALKLDYSNPNTVISATNQAKSISARPGLVTVGSVQNETISRGSSFSEKLLASTNDAGKPLQTFATGRQDGVQQPQAVAENDEALLNALKGVDPRLANISMDAIKEFKRLNPGYDVKIISGKREGDGSSRHDHGGAVDFQIIGPDGKPLPNLGGPSLAALTAGSKAGHYAPKYTELHRLAEASRVFRGETDPSYLEGDSIASGTFFGPGKNWMDSMHISGFRSSREHGSNSLGDITSGFKSREELERMGVPDDIIEAVLNAEKAGGITPMSNDDFAALGRQLYGGQNVDPTLLAKLNPNAATNLQNQRMMVMNQEESDRRLEQLKTPTPVEKVPGEDSANLEEIRRLESRLAQVEKDVKDVPVQEPAKEPTSTVTKQAPSVTPKPPTAAQEAARKNRLNPAYVEDYTGYI